MSRLGGVTKGGKEMTLVSASIVLGSVDLMRDHFLDTKEKEPSPMMLSSPTRAINNDNVISNPQVL